MATLYPKGSAEGLAEARRRIAEAKRNGAEELDIRGLGLTEIPEELSSPSKIKTLYIDLPEAAAENSTTISPMSPERFWSIVAHTIASASDPDAQTEALRNELRQLTLDDVVSFEVAFRQYLNAAYTWDLWGAAYVIHGYCSDDSFEYFRRWLVSRGRAAYEGALADPDSLAQLDAQAGPDDVWEFEEIYYVAAEVFEEMGGDGDVCEYSETEAGLDDLGPSGTPFDQDQEHLAKRYPKLWQRFGGDPLG